MTFSSTNLNPLVGSQLDCDLESLLSGRYSQDIRKLLVERGVVVIRDVPMSADQQREIARSLGDLRLGTVKKEGDEGLLKVSFDARVNPDYARFFFGTWLWHMDGTYEEYPPFATILTPHKLSKTGGETEFVNTYAAFEDLPVEEQQRLEDLQVVHTMQAALFPAKRDCDTEEFAVWYDYPNRTHPLVWRHKSGRKSLVLSTSASHIVGMHPADSHDLLQRLMAHATQEKFLYRHHWRIGDMLMWDNTGTMHRVRPFDENSGRQLFRFTLNGEEPVTGVRQISPQN